MAAGKGRGRLGRLRCGTAAHEGRMGYSTFDRKLVKRSSDWPSKKRSGGAST